jgi:cytochrome P450
VSRARDFPLGASITLEQLDRDPHPILARLRRQEPVSWLPALDGWLVTSHQLAREVMHEPLRFTVQDERFSTGRVIGPSMLSLDGDEHVRHRVPFAEPFRPRAVRDAFAYHVRADVERLIDDLEPMKAAELRRQFAGPLAAVTVTRALGLAREETSTLLGWYDAIVDAVDSITAGRPIPAAGTDAYAKLRARLLSTLHQHGLLSVVAEQRQLSAEEICSNAGVLLFGGIETTEGMISNALLHLLERPDARDDLAAAVEESLRLEPAAAVVDRYATQDTVLGGIRIGEKELVRVSIAAANRDPSVFTDPDRFDPWRANTRRHLAFAHGPHVCLGIHLARLEARTSVKLLFEKLPRLRGDPRLAPQVRGLVFRKPVTLHAVWD